MRVPRRSLHIPICAYIRRAGNANAICNCDVYRYAREEGLELLLAATAALFANTHLSSGVGHAFRSGLFFRHGSLLFISR